MAASNTQNQSAKQPRSTQSGTAPAAAASLATPEALTSSNTLTPKMLPDSLNLLQDSVCAKT